MERSEERTQRKAEAVGGRVQRLVVLLLICFRHPKPKRRARTNKPRPPTEPTPPNIGSRRDISAARVLPASRREQAQRHNDQAHPPPEAQRGGTTNGAVGGRVQRLVVPRVGVFRHATNITATKPSPKYRRPDRVLPLRANKLQRPANPNETAASNAANSSAGVLQARERLRRARHNAKLTRRPPATTN